jgi:hypothetical protein
MFIKYAMNTRVTSPKTPFNINIFEPTNFESFIKPLDFKRFSSFQKQKKKAKVLLWLSHDLDALPVIDETGGDHATDDITLANLISGASLVEIPVAENENKLERFKMTK